MTVDTGSRRLVVVVPVTNLRRKPVDAPLINVHDDLQETQLLFNELLVFKDEKEEWCRVEATEQPRLLDNRWVGLPGWVRKRDVAEVGHWQEYNGLVRGASTIVTAGPSRNAPRLFPLSLATRLHLTGEATKSFFEIDLPHHKAGWVPKKDVARQDPADAAGTGQEIVAVARLFLGVPYLWGGRSMPLAWTRGPLAGVDCSGLMSLVFRANGIDVPRDAHEQWVRATRIERKNLRPGDLIFLTRQGDGAIINHVMLFSGGEQFIEATQTGDIVRARTFADKFGLDLERIAQQDFSVSGRKIYFGRIERGS